MSCNALSSGLSVALIKHTALFTQCCVLPLWETWLLSRATSDLLLAVCPKLPIIASTRLLPECTSALEPLSRCFLFSTKAFIWLCFLHHRLQTFILYLFQYPRCSVMVLTTFFLRSQVNWNYLNKHKRKKNRLPETLHQMASLVAQMVKNLPAMQEAWVWSLGQEGPLEKGIATHSSILGWRTPWTEEPASPRGRRESDATERLTLALPSKVKNRRHLIHVHPSYIYVYFTVYAYLWVYEKLLNSICKYILSFQDTACL